MTKPLADRLLRLMFDGGGARAHLVQLDRSWLEVACKHDTSPDVMRLLGEMSCASILLSASLQYAGSVILQIHGDGPVRLAVAECNAKLGFRSTIKMSETLEPAPGADWKALVNQNNLGRFSVVLDPKIDNQHPYQGIVPLHEAGVAQALESYMQRSEQLPTRLWLACNGERAAGLLLQKMPHQGGTNKKSDAQSEAATEASDDDWERLITLAQTVTAEELLSVEAETLLHRLFWQEAPKLLEDKPVQFSCSCSRARVGRMLKTLGAEEVESILAEQGQVDVHCDFCNAAYHFDAVDCAALFTGEHPPSSEDPSTIH
ncbi:MAG: Hsp33 family molecular chaperone HslO [Burkholderiaceae bacterium]